MDAKTAPVGALSAPPAASAAPTAALAGAGADAELTFGERLRERVHENQAVINTFVAGGLAGAASRTVVSPLERLKIILQVQSSKPGGAGEAYDGVWRSLVRMWKDEGFKGFMKGNGINVIRVSVEAGGRAQRGRGRSSGGRPLWGRRWTGSDSLAAVARSSLSTRRLMVTDRAGRTSSISVSAPLSGCSARISATRAVA